MSKQKNTTNKLSLTEKYKRRVINKLEKQTDLYKNSSGSWIMFNRIFSVLLDLIVWIGIAVLVYGWWVTRGAPVGCDRITPDLCNSCFAYGKTLTGSIIG